MYECTNVRIIYAHRYVYKHKNLDQKKAFYLVSLFGISGSMLP